MRIADQIVALALFFCWGCIVLGPIALVISVLSLFGVGDGPIINGKQATNPLEKTFMVGISFLMLAMGWIYFTKYRGRRGRRTGVRRLLVVLFLLFLLLCGVFQYWGQIP